MPRIDRQRGLAQRLGIGFAAVVEIEIGDRAGEQAIGGGKARIGIFGRLARHGNAAFDELRQFGGIHVGGRDAGAALPDENAQADILPLGPLDILERAQPHRDRGRGIAIIKRVGGVGACLGRGGAQHLRAVEGFGNTQHGRALYGARRGVKIKVGWRRLQRAMAAMASVAAIAPLTHRKGRVIAATHRRRTSRRKRACSPQLASAWRLR